MSRLPALILVALLSACTSTEFNPTPGAPQYPPHRGEVTVLNKLPQSGNYDSLGVVVAYGPDLSDKNDLIEALQKEAAKRGANAIALQGEIKTRYQRQGNQQVLAAFALRLKP